MKRLITAATALALVAGTAAFANERPDFVTTNAPVLTTSVEAGSLLNTKELARRGLSAADTVVVTDFPSTGAVDAPSRDG